MFQRENQNTNLMCNFLSPENRAVYDMMWENMVQTDRPQMTADAEKVWIA
jgi:hypothetical protein